MPLYIKLPLRAIQYLFAKSVEDCAEFMCEPIFNEELKGGFFLIDQYAQPTKKADLHDQAKEFIWEHTLDIIKNTLN